MNEPLKDVYTMRRDFIKIFSAWNDNVSSSDIYHTILDWITEYKNLIKSKNDINDILDRMNSDESINPIVEDFIYGDRYKDLRNEFGGGKD
jgi:hypothetical protein